MPYLIAGVAIILAVLNMAVIIGLTRITFALMRLTSEMMRQLQEHADALA